MKDLIQLKVIPLENEYVVLMLKDKDENEYFFSLDQDKAKSLSSTILACAESLDEEREPVEPLIDDSSDLDDQC